MKAEEWRDVDPDLFEKTIRPRGRPAILRGLVQGWPAAQAGRGSPQALIEYLRGFYAGQPAPLFEGAPEINGRFFYNATLDGFNFQSRRAPLTELFDRLMEGVGDDPAHRPALYSGSVSLPIYFRGFSDANHLRKLITVPSVL